MTLHDQLLQNPVLGFKSGRFKLIPLHSSLSSEDQAAVFSKPKNNMRKIVISTNLAETSITIDDCVFVVEVRELVSALADSANVRRFDDLSLFLTTFNHFDGLSPF